MRCAVENKQISTELECDTSLVTIAGNSIERITAREEKFKKQLLHRLCCVEGQVRGLMGMIEKDAYCDDVLIQVAAARAALTSISKLVLKNHVSGCFVAKIRNGETEVVDELLKTIEKLL